MRDAHEAGAGVGAEAQAILTAEAQPIPVEKPKRSPRFKGLGGEDRLFGSMAEATPTVAEPSESLEEPVPPMPEVAILKEMVHNSRLLGLVFSYLDLKAPKEKGNEPKSFFSFAGISLILRGVFFAITSPGTVMDMYKLYKSPNMGIKLISQALANDDISNFVISQADNLPRFGAVMGLKTQDDTAVIDIESLEILRHAIQEGNIEIIKLILQESTKPKPDYKVMTQNALTLLAADPYIRDYLQLKESQLTKELYKYYDSPPTRSELETALDQAKALEQLSPNDRTKVLDIFSNHIENNTLTKETLSQDAELKKIFSATGNLEAACDVVLQTKSSVRQYFDLYKIKREAIDLVPTLLDNLGYLAEIQDDFSSGVPLFITIERILTLVEKAKKPDAASTMLKEFVSRADLKQPVAAIIEQTPALQTLVAQYGMDLKVLDIIDVLLSKPKIALGIIEELSKPNYMKDEKGNPVGIDYSTLANKCIEALIAIPELQTILTERTDVLIALTKGIIIQNDKFSKEHPVAVGQPQPASMKDRLKSYGIELEDLDSLAEIFPLLVTKPENLQQILTQFTAGQYVGMVGTILEFASSNPEIQQYCSKNTAIFAKIISASTGLQTEELAKLIPIIIDVLLSKPKIALGIIKELSKPNYMKDEKGNPVGIDYSTLANKCIEALIAIPELPTKLAGQKGALIALAKGIITQNDKLSKEHPVAVGQPQPASMKDRLKSYGIELEDLDSLAEIFPLLVTKPENLQQILTQFTEGQYVDMVGTILKFASSNPEIQQYCSKNTAIFAKIISASTGIKVEELVGLIPILLKQHHLNELIPLIALYKEGDYNGLIIGICGLLEKEEIRRFFEANPDSLKKLIGKLIEKFPAIRNTLEGLGVSSGTAVDLTTNITTALLYNSDAIKAVMTVRKGADILTLTSAMGAVLKLSARATVGAPSLISTALSTSSAIASRRIWGDTTQQHLFELATTELSVEKSPQFSAVQQDLALYMRSNLTKIDVAHLGKIEDIDVTNLSNITVANKSFANFKLENFAFVNSTLRHISFNNAVLNNVNFDYATFQDVNFASATMDVETFMTLLPALKRGEISLYGTTITGSLDDIDLQGIDLTGVSIAGTHPRSALSGSEIASIQELSKKVGKQLFGEGTEYNRSKDVDQLSSALIQVCHELKSKNKHISFDRIAENQDLIGELVWGRGWGVIKNTVTKSTGITGIVYTEATSYTSAGLVTGGIFIDIDKLHSESVSQAITNTISKALDPSSKMASPPSTTPKPPAHPSMLPMSSTSRSM